MAEESPVKLNNGVFTSLFDENKREDEFLFLQDVESKCLSSKWSEVKDSGIASDLDHAVAALETRDNNILEHSVTSEGSTERFHTGQEVEHRTVVQDRLTQEWTIAEHDLTAPQHDNPETTKPRDFSELRAMFSQTDSTHKLSSPNKGKSHQSNPAKMIILNLGNIDMELTSSNDVSNELQRNGDSLVARMKRNFETASDSSEVSVEKTTRYQKPVSFEVGLDDCVTPGSLSHDTSLTQSEHIFRNESSDTSLGNFTCIDSLDSNQQTTKDEYPGATTSSSPRSIDIRFDDKPSKSLRPKTMPKPTVMKTLTTRFNDNQTVEVVDERKQTLEQQGQVKDLAADENSIETQKKSYSFEVSFEDDSPMKMKSRERLNKLVVKKPCRTERPPEDIAASRGVYSPLDNGNQHTEQEDATAKPDSSINSYLSSVSVISSSENVSCDKDAAPEVTREHSLATESKEDNEKEEMRKATHGISFNISFDEDSVGKSTLTQKPKLTPKHIRLKMTKPKPQRNTENQIAPDVKTTLTSSVSLPEPIRPRVKEASERNTYTLDEVSNSLQLACEKGLTLEDAIDDLAKQQELKELQKKGVALESTVTDEDASQKRGTYSLDEVATCLVAAADKGLTVAEALDTLANSQKPEGKELDMQCYYDQDQNTKIETSKDTSLNRGTYDLNEVSHKIDDEKEKGGTLEEALIQLLDEVECVVKETQKTTNRGTYDLKDVSKTVQDARDRGIPVEKTLEKIATVEDETKKTDSLISTTATDEKKQVCNEEYNVDFGKVKSGTSAGKRGTYSLNDVQKQLELASDRGSSIVDTLSDISQPKPDEINSFPKINRNQSAKENETSTTRNTYTLDEVAQSLEIAKSEGIPIVEALSSMTTEKPVEELAQPGSRGTYTLDQVALSLETAREKGLPIVMALENLVLQGDGTLKGPAEVAVHRRQGKLTNRKTYALASPLETIGEEKQLRLFDGTSRKLLPPTKDYLQEPETLLYDDPENVQSPGQNVVQTLDLLTSACEALLKTTAKKKDSEKTDEDGASQPQIVYDESRELRQQFKAESRDSGISFLSGPSERGTYSLDDVSESLEGAEKRGIPVIEALGSLAVKEPVRKYRVPRALRKAGSKSESSLTRMTKPKEESSRQTYSLDNVSNTVEDAKAKGIPVIAALDELTNSLARFSATRSTPGKPLKKPDRPSITRKKEAERQERTNVRSEFGREVPKQSGVSFPISYPPAMRNSYSLDDVASAFEKAYQTGIPFQNVLEGMQPGDGDSNQPTEDAAITKSTGSLKIGKDPLQSTTVYEDYTRKTHSVSSLTRSNEFSIPALSDSSLDSKTVPPPRKSSSSSEGSLSCSSSYGSDMSVNRDSSSTEELPHLSKASSVRKQRRQSNGPFQLKKGNRRNSPANLGKLDTSSSSLQGDSLKSLESRESEAFESSHSKRGTYDLKKVGEELDRFKVQGIPVIKGLDKLVTDVNSIGKTEHKESKDAEVTPKRGTYSLEDVSKQLDSRMGDDSVVRVLDTLSSNPDLSSRSASSKIELQRDSTLSQSSVPDAKSRNTFLLDHVDVSIADAASRGVPVIDPLDNLSQVGNLDTTKTSKHRRESPFKPNAPKPTQDGFFKKYFPLKTEEEVPKFRGDYGETVQVGDERALKHQDLDNYPARDNNVSERDGTVTVRTTEHSQLKESYGVPDVVEQTFNETERAGKRDTNLQEKLSQVQLSQDEKVTQDELSGGGKLTGTSDEVSTTSRTRPRWQRSGSYVEALESFEDMLATEQDLTSSQALDCIPVKESNYVNDKYDTMYPESVNKETDTSPRGRSTWTPSGSVLDKILNLMDEHEEQGLTIADALEKAAEISEQQGETDDSKTNVNFEDVHRRSEERMTCERKVLDLNRDEEYGHVETKFPESNDTAHPSDFGCQGNQSRGYQAESIDHSIVTILQDTLPQKQLLENMIQSESTLPRHCWEAETPTVPLTVKGLASPLSDDVNRYEQQGKTGADDDVHEEQDSSSNKVFSMFIGDESEQTKQGLTPEQQKKRDRFLRSRQKKMEEEKARRETENERKKQREIRQQENEARKRLQHLNQQVEEHPSRAEYRSPPRIIKSSGKSNRKMISNALSHACLSGAVNNENRERCLQAMSESQGNHFIILLKEGLRFRGLYVYSPENEQAYKIYGTGPKIVSSNMVDCVYKYNSGSKEFIKIPSKTLSISIDGVAINKIYWQSNKPNVPSKTQSNLKRPPRPPQR